MGSLFGIGSGRGRRSGRKPATPSAAVEAAPRDPGLQRERTALAWQRTALSTAMIALLLAFACFRSGFLIGSAVAGLVAVAAGATLFIGRKRATRGTAGSPWTPLTRIAVLLMVTAVLGAVLALLVLL